MDPLTLVILSIVGGTVFGTVFTQISKEDNWYDHLNDYMSFPKEDTDLIDQMLISYPLYSKIGKRKIIGGSSIPDEGVHYYYFEPEGQRGLFFNYYLGLKKIKKTAAANSADHHYTYDAWISPWSRPKLEKFTQKLRIQETGSVRTISIDCSSMSPREEKYR